jgi:hypothetical protein
VWHSRCGSLTPASLSAATGCGGPRHLSAIAWPDRPRRVFDAIPNAYGRERGTDGQSVGADRASVASPTAAAAVGETIAESSTASCGSFRPARLGETGPSAAARGRPRTSGCGVGLMTALGTRCSRKRSGKTSGHRPRSGRRAGALRPEGAGAWPDDGFPTARRRSQGLVWASFFGIG